MLERIELIQGTGLFHDAEGKRHTCRKATLVFADNGRGKSTLAGVLRAASSGDVGSVNAARTLDGILPPKVVLQFESGHKVTFEKNVWSEIRPELLVFDAAFVEQNVHSGGVVTTTHRKNLLDFALGTSAVDARRDLEQATKDSSAAGQLINSYMTQLIGFHAGFTLAAFEALPFEERVEGTMAEIRRRITDATNIAAILAKPIPAAVPEPNLDLTELFAVLRSALPNVHETADAMVHSHVARLGRPGSERWLSEGVDLAEGDTCPFCEQSITSSELVAAYRTYFDDAYNSLKDRVARVSEEATASVSAEVISSVERGVTLAQASIGGWLEHIELAAVSFEPEEARLALLSMRTPVVDLLRRKSDRPLEAIGSEDEEAQCAAVWTRFLEIVRTVNLQIDEAREEIQRFRSTLESESLDALHAEVRRLEACQRRHTPAVSALFGELEVARTEQKRADKAKKEARTRLDLEMAKTLEAYQASINDVLTKFGAGFQIDGLGANHFGKSPRSEYGILLRGKTVPLEGGPPSFATALSEGDKRTLAFAFFIASAQADAALSSRIIVIDDPMCSLDVNRRNHTHRLIRNLYKNAKQLMVLAHDPYFLRDLERGILKQDKTAHIGKFRLVAVANEYTSFDHLDLAVECESVYVKNHRLLSEFDAGQTHDTLRVAEAIRPLLEGYLHRRFPGHVPADMLFGDVVQSIKAAAAPNPLRHAQNLVDELNEINDFAGQFHHDTRADSGPFNVTASELRPFVRGALAVVHTGAPLS